MLVIFVDVHSIIHAYTAEILGNRMEDVIFSTFLSICMQGPAFSTEICVSIIEVDYVEWNGMEWNLPKKLNEI
jgi:hypothetical protein